MSITSDLIRGNTEMIILAHLIRQDSYGYQINKTISERTGSRFELKEATLYSAFRRLEEAGYLIFYWGDEATGARRRYYRITPQGRAAYSQYLEDWRQAKTLIDSIIAQTEGDHDHGTEN